MGSLLVWPIVLVLMAATGCGGGNPAKDAGSDAADANADTGGDVPPSQDLGTDIFGSDAADAGPDATNDVATDTGSDVPTDTPGDVGGDTPTDVPADVITDAPTEEGPPPPPVMLIVDALQNSIVLERCTGLTPATLVNVTGGAHTIALTASTLSKGSVSGPNDTQLPSFDDYVIVNIPLGAADQSSRRFFMLNGIGSMANFTLPASAMVKLMFIDGDAAFNAGQGTVTLDATGASATVDATANVLAWNTGCFSTPASVNISDRPHRATLTESTLSIGGGSKDDFVILRMPSDRPMEPFRFVILNGVGASIDFTPYMTQTIRGWFISSTAGATGRATVVVTDL